MTNIIEVEDLKKTYKGKVKAVDDISFNVEQGEIFGFLGPNGAGKTTVINILTTLLKKTGGKATVAGFDVEDKPSDIRKAVGYTAQSIEIDEDLSGRENIMLAARLYHLPGKQVKQRTEELLNVLGLVDAANRQAGTYSGGMRKRLDLATAMVHDPKVLFLDEPTTGLDPQSRFALWKYVEDLNEKGSTIFLTTQYMEEADHLCERLAIIDNGKIVVEGTPKDLKEKIGADTISIEIKGQDAKSHQEKAKEALSKLSFVLDTKPIKDNHLTVYIKNGGEAISDIIKILHEIKVPLGPLSLSEGTLDDVFLKYTGHQLRVEEEKKKGGLPNRMKRKGPR